MGRNIMFLTLFCFVAFHGNKACARLTVEYLKLSQGVFDIPGEIKKAAGASELQTFLTSNKEFTRMAAIRRLGEVDRARAIPRLLDIFEKEGPTRGIDRAPLVRLEVIRTIGRIGSDRSREVLLNTLNQWWQRGPNVKDKRDYLLDRDFCFIVPALLRALEAWSGDPAVLETVERIAVSDDVRQFYNRPRTLGQTAWETYLKAKMAKENIVDEKGSATYLLGLMVVPRKQLSENTSSEVDVLTFLKCQAAAAILARHSQATLSSLIAELDEEIREEPYPPEGSLSEYGAELRARRGCVKAALREKAWHDGLRERTESPVGR